jgi:protein tyrosine phosphatase (PTP) superfamily phosphohydrolase (DUF442 family)
MLNIDTTALMDTVSKEVQTEYKEMFDKLRKDQQALFMDIVKGIQKEYLAATFGPVEARAVHEQNLASYRNALAALEGITAIRVYRTTINMIARITVALLKAMAKAAIGL